MNRILTRFLLITFVFIDTGKLKALETNKYPLIFNIFIKEAHYAILVKAKSIERMVIPSSEKEAKEQGLTLTNIEFMRNVKLDLVDRKIIFGEAPDSLIIFLTADFKIVNIWRIVPHSNNIYSARGWQLAYCKWDYKDKVLSNVSSNPNHYSYNNSFQNKSLLVSYTSKQLNFFLEDKDKPKHPYDR